MNLHRPQNDNLAGCRDNAMIQPPRSICLPLRCASQARTFRISDHDHPADPLYRQPRCREALIASLDAKTRWHVLDAQQDGMAQIERPC